MDYDACEVPYRPNRRFLQTCHLHFASGESVLDARAGLEVAIHMFSKVCVPYIWVVARSADPLRNRFLRSGISTYPGPQPVQCKPRLRHFFVMVFLQRCALISSFLDRSCAHRPRIPIGWSAMDILYYALWIGILAWILWAILSPCIPSLRSGRNRTNRPPGGGTRPNTYTGSGGGFSSSRHNPPPPPYSGHPPKNPSSSSSSSPGSGGNWRPGFWTGLGAGAAGTYLATNAARNRGNNYDWEQSQFAAPPQPSARQTSYSPPTSSYQAMGQGEGSSSGGGSLGPTRRATGYGGTNVR